MANGNQRATSPSYFHLFSVLHIVDTVMHTYRFSIVEFPEYDMNVYFPNYINFLLSTLLQFNAGT